MPLQFRFIPGPPASLIERVAASDPTNPFFTLEYATALRSLGAQPCFLGGYNENQLTSGCVAFLSGSFLRRTLTIPSLPDLTDPPVFWRGLLEACRKMKVWHLQIDSFASRASEIPQLAGELTRRPRVEYVLDLERENVLDGFSTQHRRNISRASKANLTIRRSGEESACAQHFELIDASLDRRAHRGEEIQRLEMALPSALLASKSGEIFQAVDGDRVLSSILVLKSRQGAYYQSSGTLPDGMKLGSSPFLIAQVAAMLKQEGVRVFNLGGAGDDSPGLQRFKAGFNTREVRLEAATFCPRRAVERKFHAALRFCWHWIKQR